MSTLTARGEAERTRAVGAYIAKRTWGSSSVQLKHRHPTERIASTEPNQDRPDTKSKHKSFAQPTKGSSSGLSLCCFHSDGSPLRKIFFGPVGGGLLTSRAAFASAIAPITYHLLAPCSTCSSDQDADTKTHKTRITLLLLRLHISLADRAQRPLGSCPLLEKLDISTKSI